MKKILVMAPRHPDVVQAAVLPVNTQPRLIGGLPAVRVVLKKLVKDNALRPGAAHRKGVAHHGPLRFAIQTKNLPKVMNQPCEDEPTRLAVPADLLCCLQQVVQL